MNKRTMNKDINKYIGYIFLYAIANCPKPDLGRYRPSVKNSKRRKEIDKQIKIEIHRQLGSWFLFRKRWKHYINE